MFKVLYKSSNAAQAWSSLGSYGSESSALAAAERIAGRAFVVCVRNPEGRIIWSS